MKINKTLFSCLLFILSFSFCKFPSPFARATAETETFSTTAESMCLMESTSGRILAQKDADKQLPMASLTKVITAIVAIENTEDLDKKLTIERSAQGVEGSSIYLRAGEKLSMRELLFGLMLRSGNDAAVAIATFVSGSAENFAEKCNEFCKSIGANNTHLTNPHGLHDDNHYTTAKDLALVSSYALKNDIFSKIVSSKRATIDNQKGKNATRELVNKNKFLSMLNYADGVKTGYTKKAGRCFIGSATKDDMQVVCVLLNCNPMFAECKYLIQKAFETYKMRTLVDDNGYQTEIEILGQKVPAKTNGELVYPMTETEQQSLQYVVKPTFDSIQSIQKGEKLAELQIFIDKQMILCDNIYSTIEIKDNSLKENIEKVIENF